jgi:signal transduction histidine kinase
LRDWVGPEPERTRVDVVTIRRYFRGVSAGGAVVASNLRSRRERSLQEGKGAATEDINEALNIMERLNADVILFIEGEDDLLGLICIKDEKIRDNFSADEIKALTQLASQVSVVVENTKLYKQMKERDRLAVLGQMSAGMAHEIRNPLGAIKAAAQFIEEDIYEQAENKDDVEDVEYLSIIVEEANRLNRVVNDFLSYARPSTGQPAEVDPNEIVQKTIQVFTAGNTATAEIVLDLDEDIPPVYIDGERLHQAFLNLIINANQAMDKQENGQLTISTRRRKFRRLARDTGESENTELVEIRFSDNGPGIEPNVLENIFIPFYTTKQSGSGLGLAVCQRLIRDSGGDIEVRSQVGQGSIFSVILPISTQRSSQNAE